MDDPAPLSPLNKSSFAYKTVKDRVPDIITKIVDGLHRFGITDSDEETDWESVKVIIGHLSRLRYEVMTDKPLVPFDPVYTTDDNELWDQAMQKYTDENGKPPTWFTSPWLYWECYLYRYFQVLVATVGLPKLDLFKKNKRTQYTSSKEAIETLANFASASLTDKLPSSEKREHYFHQFLQICLWGNECDLSISGMAENAQTRDPLASLASLKERIISDDSQRLWSHLQAASSSSSSSSTITIVLDNAGFELFGDLCFADFLLHAGLASRVVFHGKTMPWFISDVTRADFTWTLDQVAAHAGSDAVRKLGARWKQYIANGTFVYKEHFFWTTCYDYASMAKVCPDLHAGLAESRLIVFKGDLNYRKLVGDLQWETTVSFNRALRGFHPAPLCSLRVCKADVVVGLQPGVEEKLSAEMENWMYAGKFAVVQAEL